MLGFATRGGLTLGSSEIADFATLIEYVAESDDTLMEKFFEQGILAEEEFRAGLHQACRQPQRRGARGAVLEATGVGDQADVQGFRDRLRQLDPQPVADAR